VIAGWDRRYVDEVEDWERLPREGVAPGKRTLTQSLAPGRQRARTEAGPADSAGPAVADLPDDPFSLHLLGASQGAAPAAATIDAAQRAGLGDVSGVRLHTGEVAQAAAEAHDAHAFTIGSDVYFGPGQYRPGTPDGDRLLGHELAHASQQRSAGATAMAAKLRTSEPGDVAEREADHAGDVFADAMAGVMVAPVAISAAPVSLAREKKGAGGKRPPAIRMRVIARMRDGQVKEWSGTSAATDADGTRLTARREGGRWVWDDERGRGVRVKGNDPRGSGGAPVETWAGDAESIVVDFGSATEDTIPEGAGTGGDGGGATDTGRTSLEPAQGAGGRADQTGPRAGGAAGGRSPGTSDTPGAGDRAGQGTRVDADGGADQATAEADDSADEAEVDAEAAAQDAEIDAFLDEIGADDGGGGGDGQGIDPNGSPDGRTGEDTRDDGQGKGGRGAEYGGGQNKGPDSNRGGADVKDDTVGGETNPNATASRVGGGDGGQAGGVVGGSSVGILGFTITIPESLQAAVEIALVVDDANIAGFGVGTVRKAAQEATEHIIEKRATAEIRRALRRKASEAAAERMRAFRKELAAAKKAPADQLTKRQRRILKEWGSLSRSETARALRVTQWEMQRSFFKETAKAARTESKKLRRALRRARKNPIKRAEVQDKLAAVDQLADAARVAPIAGRLPIGHKYAGQDFPADKLPEKYRANGLRVDADGFPEFEPYALTLPNGKKSVRIEYTGSRTKDFAEANRLAGFKRTPEGFTWHHHQDVGEMILIPTDLHDAVKHSGGVVVNKHATGVETYAP
jgi:hypothetical protein